MNTTVTFSESQTIQELLHEWGVTDSSPVSYSPLSIIMHGYRDGVEVALRFPRKWQNIEEHIILDRAGVGTVFLEGDERTSATLVEWVDGNEPTEDDVPGIMKALVDLHSFQGDYPSIPLWENRLDTIHTGALANYHRVEKEINKKDVHWGTIHNKLYHELRGNISDLRFVHGDMKPSNVLTSPRGGVTLIDPHMVLAPRSWDLTSLAVEVSHGGSNALPALRAMLSMYNHYDPVSPLDEESVVGMLTYRLLGYGFLLTAKNDPHGQDTFDMVVHLLSL